MRSGTDIITFSVPGGGPTVNPATGASVAQADLQSRTQRQDPGPTADVRHPYPGGTQTRKTGRTSRPVAVEHRRRPDVLHRDSDHQTGSVLGLL